jgi:hypothetical protein
VACVLDAGLPERFNRVRLDVGEYVHNQHCFSKAQVSNLQFQFETWF